MKNTQSSSDCCPTCGRPWKPEPKKCYRCKKAIGRGHKFIYVNIRGITTIVHKVCDDPSSYYTRTEKEALKKANRAGDRKKADRVREKADKRLQDLVRFATTGSIDSPRSRRASSKHRTRKNRRTSK